MTRGDDMNPSSIREEPGVGLEVDDVEIVARELLNHTGMDWSRVRRTAYLLHQHVRYKYPAPIRDLRHRLVIVPPRVHGDNAGCSIALTSRAPSLGHHPGWTNSATTSST